MQQAAVRYDRAGDQHYDVTSALIKSVRGSDVDAALHYLARMVEAGEDPRFIARRLVILASEDIGMADPTALQTAVAAMHAVAQIGLPEARLTLAQAVVAPEPGAEVQRGDRGDRRRAGRCPRRSRRPGARAPARCALRAARRRSGHGVHVPVRRTTTPAGVVAQQYLPDGPRRARYYRPGRPRGRGALERGVAERLRALLGRVE